VTDEKVVHASLGAQYAALSYVWGGAQSLSMTKANQTTLRQPGSLKRATRTIRHAMRFCRKEIKVKFLWVDAICIVQDDEAHMASQVMNMVSIYANAYVTLVAAWGRNADAGLRPKEFKSYGMDLFRFKKIWSPVSHDSSPMHKVYSTRSGRVLRYTLNSSSTTAVGA
jgi:hypothetical protein